MEHKLITGGEQYLPFARSRIKALKATGLAHASQKFVLDGADVEVRITPEHEFIRITGGGCSMEMDSGVIDVRTIYPLNPLIYKPGVFVDSTRTLQYNAGFTQVSNNGKWKISPGTAKQFAGKVTGSGKTWKGRIQYPVNPPASFAPLKTIEEDGTVTYAEEDENLAAKNQSTTKVPASSFTGRMRLYVQAMYGEGLYKYPEGELRSTASSWGYDLPGLNIPPGDPYKTDLPPGVTTGANVSSGVLLDSMGKHWLTIVGNDTLYIMPLIGSKCAEASRKLIMPSSSVLNAEDKQHLETYILASCRPHTRKTVAVPLGGNYNSVQMGFGWHWNWSGNCADIVENEEYFQGTYNGGFSARPNMAIESTHRRMTVTWAEDDNGNRTWNASVATVEKKKWASLRNAWGVCYPVYGDPRSAGKVVPRWTELFESSGAPFYVFYKDDVAQVCRISVTKHAKGSTHNNTPNYTPSAGLVEGDRPGYYDWTDDDNDWWSGSMTIGDASYEMATYNRSATGSQSRTDCVAAGGDPFANYGGAYVTDQTRTFQVGYPSAYSTITVYAKLWGSGAVYRQFLTRTSSGVRDVYGGTGCAVVPFDDAESIYVWSSAGKTRQHTSVREVVGDSTSCGFYALTWDENGNPIKAYLTYVWGPSGHSDTIVSDTPRDDYTEVIQEIENQVLHCAAGVVEVENMDGSMNDYLVPQYDLATPVFNVTSSAKPGPDAAVFNTFSPPENVPAFDKHFPVIVGWA